MVRRVLGADVPSLPPRRQPAYDEHVGPGYLPRRGAPAEPLMPAGTVSSTPPGHAKLRGPGGWQLSGPWQAIAVGVLVAAVLWFLRSQVEALRGELRAHQELEAKRFEIIERALSGNPLTGDLGVAARIGALESRERHNTELLAGVANRLGANLRYEDGTKPDVQFHAAPLGVRGAPVQPKDVLQQPPETKP